MAVAVLCAAEAAATPVGGAGIARAAPHAAPDPIAPSQVVTGAPVAQLAASIVDAITSTRATTVYTHNTVISPTLGPLRHGLLRLRLLPALAGSAAATGVGAARAGLLDPARLHVLRVLPRLQSGSQAIGRTSVAKLADAQPGDVGWGLFPIEQYQDTGHVFIVAGSPRPQADGTYLVPVYDSSSVPHYSDTRHYPAGGVGAGDLRFQIDATGVISAVQFNAPDQYHAVPAGIGRLTGGSSGSQAYLPLTARQSTGW